MKIPQNTTPDDSENPFKADGANSHFENENEVNETPFPIRNIPLTTKLRSNHGRQKWISKIEFASRLSFFFRFAKGEGPNGQINSIRVGTGTCLPVTRKLYAFLHFAKRYLPGVVKALCRPTMDPVFPGFLRDFCPSPWVVVFVFISISIRWRSGSLFWFSRLGRFWVLNLEKVRFVHCYSLRYFIKPFFNQM